MKFSGRAVFVSILLVLGALSIVLPVERTSAGTPVQGIVPSDTVWTASGSPYWVEGVVTVPEGVTLTVEPGVEVRFNGSFSITVNGTLISIGTNESRIIYTSNRSAPFFPDWESIDIVPTGSVEFSYSNVSYSFWGLKLQSSVNNISHSGFHDNFFGITLQNALDNTVVSNHIHDNDYGLQAINSTGNNVSGNSFCHNRVGITLSSSSDGNTLANNNVSFNDFSGMSLYESRWNSVMNNTMWGNGYGNLRVSGDDRESYNNTIPVSNLVNGKPVYYYFGIHDYVIQDLSAGHITVAGSENVTVVGVSIENADPLHLAFSNETRIVNCSVSESYYGLNIADSHSTVVESVYLANNRYAAFVTASSNSSFVESDLLENDDGYNIRSSFNITIRDNNITGGMSGVRMHEVANSSVLRNQRDGNSQGGFQFSNVENTTVADNYLRTNSYGITMDYSFNNTVSDNTVLDSHWGIMFGHVLFTILERNEVKRCDYALYMNDSRYNWISNSTFDSATDSAVVMTASSFNTIVGNTVSNSENGIRLFDSGSNDIYHNNVINNTNQGFDWDSTTNWDAGYPLGGNYWSDYTGVDEFSGPDQDQPGSDGIGDTPYPMEGAGANQDFYPLMFPAGHVEPPRNITASLSGAGLSDITVQWDLSLDDGEGANDVVRYEVFRGTGCYNPSGSDYQLADTVPNGSRSYIDLGRGNGDPNDHFYIVCAVDAWNNSRCASAQAGKFTRQLPTGPSLISIPLVQSSESIEIALQTIELDRAWAYDSFRGEWKSYMRSKPYKGTLNTINHTMGLWINVTGQSNLTVAGAVPTHTVIHLHKGWNLVGFPSLDSTYTVADLKASVPVERVEAFDASAPPNFLKVLEDSDILLASRAYWVRVSADAAWIVMPG